MELWDDNKHAPLVLQVRAGSALSASALRQHTYIHTWSVVFCLLAALLSLQCGHTLCAGCFSALPQPRRCPLDRTPEPRKLSAIPRNYALLEAAAAAAAAAAAGAAGKQSAASSAGRHSSRSRSRSDDSDGAFDASHLQFSRTILGRSAGGVASVVEGTYRGKQVGVSMLAGAALPGCLCVSGRSSHISSWRLCCY